MASGIVYDGVASANGEASTSSNKLFSGMKFWLSHGLPQRQWLLQNAQANGAEIVPLELQADLRFVDHARKNQAPGTHSYRFIELSIRNGQLEDLDAHAVGVETRVQRTVGSTVTAPKKGRTPFTDAEDQWLWNMIKPHMNNGGNWKGNEIYKQLERLNPRHTYQSWRDRWIKYVNYQNREISEQFDREAMVGELPTAQPISSTAPARTVIRQPPTQHVVVDRVSVSEQPARSREAIPASKISVEVPLHRPSLPNRPIISDDSDPPVVQPSRRSRQTGPDVRSPRRKPRTGSDDSEPSRSAPPKRILPWFGPTRQIRSFTHEHGRPRTPQTMDQRRDHQHQPAPHAIITPESLRTPGFHRDPIIFTRRELGQFTAEEAGQLYKAVKYIEIAPRKKHDEAWDAWADENRESGHTTKEWKSFYASVILPRYRSRRQDRVVPRDEDSSEDEEPASHEPVKRRVGGTAILSSGDADDTETQQESGIRSIPYTTTCIKCMTTETTRWRHDRKGRTLCNDCGQLSRNLGVLRPSTALVDIEDEADHDGSGGEEIRDEEPLGEGLPNAMNQDVGSEKEPTPSPLPTTSISGKNMVDRKVGSSPVIRQQSPTFEPVSPSAGRASESNIARKRTSARSQSTSQETAKSQTSLYEAIDEKSVRRLQTPPISLRKRKRLSDDPNALEIPPTPEHLLQDLGSFSSIAAQLRSPGMPPKRPARNKSPLPRSAMFFDGGQDDDEVDVDEPDANPPSSPLAINLVSDPVGLSSQPEQGDNSSDIETASVYNFETAPDISNEWETAPESPTWAGARVETQALFNHSNIIDFTEEDFELPPPEGGWDGVEGPEPDVLQSVEVAEDELDEAEALSEAEINTWIDSNKERWSMLNQAHIETISQAAIMSTSMTDYGIADQAMEEMIRIYKRWGATKVINEGRVILPNDMAGCWTKEDDRLLRSSNASDIAKVHRKHGNDKCNERQDFMVAWGV